MKKRSYHYIIRSGWVCIAVDGQVDVHGKSWEMYEWAEIDKNVLIELEHIDEDEFKKTDKSPEHEKFYYVFDLDCFILGQVEKTSQERDVGAYAT